MGNQNQKLIYVPMVADYIHHGHINIINIARTYGDVMVGLMTDKSAASYKRLPLLSYEERYKIVSNIKGVKEVVPQDQLDFVKPILKYKPDIFIHGSDWKNGVQKESRRRVFEAMEQIGGEVIEPDYTKEISSTLINKSILAAGVSPDFRLSRLKKYLENKPLIRGIDVHNGLTSLIAENTCINLNGIQKEFDFLWMSSLTESTAKGKPDTELVDITSRLNTVRDVIDVSTKPIIFDADTGGKLEHFPYLINTLERVGISACIIEDKKGLKRNSLFGTDVEQFQEEIEDFCKKIEIGKKASISNDFMVIARIESLILEKGLDDAVARAHAYINSGADGIMIHSRKKSPDEIKDFCKIYKKIENRPPLVVVPSSFNAIYENELEEMGVNIVIYANQLLRSAHPAMVRTAKSILENSRSLECDSDLMSIKEILNLVPDV
tara:strand:+ start:16829 stop:18139 length:1311 start_codon:yes stop_codon:yes gene_type:complete